MLPVINGHFRGCITPENCQCEMKIYAFALLVGFITFGLQIFGGYYSGSLSLVADAGHLFVDNIALGLNVYVVYLVKKHYRHEKRIRAYGGYVNAFLLAGIGAWVLTEAITRFGSTHLILGWWMFIFAVIGLGGNYVQRWILGREAPTVTHKSAQMHVDSDILQSWSVIAAAILITATNWPVIDLVVSVWVSWRLFKWSWQLAKASEHGHHTDHHGHHH